MPPKDLESSIEFVRGLKEVDGDKICIWGRSYGVGGHMSSCKFSNFRKDKGVDLYF